MKVIAQRIFAFTVYKGLEIISLTSCLQTVCMSLFERLVASVLFTPGPIPVILVCEASG